VQPSIFIFRWFHHKNEFSDKAEIKAFFFLQTKASIADMQILVHYLAKELAKHKNELHEIGFGLWITKQNQFAVQLLTDTF